MRTTVIGICLLMLVGAICFAVQADKYPTIAYRDADDHIGEIVWVEGKVLTTLTETEGTYLCFNNNDKYIRVLIPIKDIGNFEGSLKHMYVGKNIKAIGKVQQYGSKLIIGVNEPKRIQIVEETT